MESPQQSKRAEEILQTVAEVLRQEVEDGATQTCIVGIVKNDPKFQKLTRDPESSSDLMQFLGVALRGVLPYAENEVGGLWNSAHRDNDPALREEAQKGSEHITRAQAALNRLNETPLSIEEIEDDAFDDTFEIRFDEE